MPRPLRITIVQGAFLPVPPLLGGAVEKAWFALGREFARTGHSVTHVGRSHPDLPVEQTEAGVHYRRVRGYDTPRSMWRLKSQDLLYSLRVARSLPPSDILVTNTFWMPAIERRHSRGCPYVHVARYPKGQLRWYPRRAILQTVSKPIREAILREVPNAAARVRVVPYPLSPVYLTEREAGEPVILYAGRVHPEKGVHLLVDAFARLKTSGMQGWTLRIVGPWETRLGGGGDEYHAKLVAAARRAGSGIEFLGPIFNEQELVSHYRRAQVFAYPSLAERGETFGLAVLEAMAAGCAPIVSDLACFRDFVRNQTNGLVFDHRASDPAGQLAATLQQVLSDATKRTELRAAAWTTARAYALPEIAARFIRDFSSLTLNHGTDECPMADAISEPK